MGTPSIYIYAHTEKSRAKIRALSEGELGGAGDLFVCCVCLLEKVWLLFAISLLAGSIVLFVLIKFIRRDLSNGNYTPMRQAIEFIMGIMVVQGTRTGPYYLKLGKINKLNYFREYGRQCRRAIPSTSHSVIHWCLVFGRFCPCYRIQQRSHLVRHCP